jgi:hypothetical protein
MGILARKSNGYQWIVLKLVCIYRFEGKNDLIYRITSDILAMARPTQKAIEKFDIIGQFKR